ncbi:hypothetical protein ABID26_006268 [Mesorhizobium shonense]|uniref:Uncharacterized protein n=1 Tax=Mesorhizobium shonense TaxID=1209948 RepID=A0ABV2I2L1_9HYPH
MPDLEEIMEAAGPRRKLRAEFARPQKSAHDPQE